MEGMSKWLTPAVGALLGGALFLVARLLDPGTVAVLCAQPPVAAPVPVVPAPSELKWFHLSPRPLPVQKLD